VIASTGPRAFCAREQVLAYYNTRERILGKLTPARRLLFASGHFIHDFVVKQFLEQSRFGGYVYAKWSCRDYDGDDTKHSTITDIAANVIGGFTVLAHETFSPVKESKLCRCGLPLERYNEIDLLIESLRITGHPDLILYYNGWFYIYEMKTIDRRDMDFDAITVPLADHRIQVSMYYKIMRANKMNVSSRLTAVYIDRSNSKLFGGYPYKSLVFRPEPDKVMDRYKNRLLHVVHGIKTGKLPPRICPTIKCERAKSCDAAIECFERKGDIDADQVHRGSRPSTTQHRSKHLRQLRKRNKVGKPNNKTRLTGPRKR
jgi:hypothetical protein